jgi:hypothetical protein
MKIFKQEISDGIAELVKSTASIAYVSEPSVRTADKDWFSRNSKPLSQTTIDKVLAENKDQQDLYYLEAILVSTGWNKNDDVFLPNNVWAARKTPEDKQFNFMHDEDDIIGHITGSYVLSKDGQAVSDEAVMPEEFDIVTQAVLYNSWMKPENRERMEEIIKEIPEGKWFVSMECLFGGFDYALIDPQGVAKILSRDESSAFLTKHLRAYGGTGEYENYKIGRALSNISFSGKGLVSKPANPRSVILNSKTVASFNVKSDELLSIGEINMSADNSLLESQLAETKQQLKAALAEIEAVKSQIAEAKDKEFSSKISAYESDLQLAKSNSEQLDELVKSTQARVAELEDALASSKDALAKAMKDMDEMKKKEKMEKRKAALLDAGLEQEDVDSTLNSLDSLDDPAFEAIAGMMKKKVAKKHYDKEDDKDGKGDASVTEPSLDGIGDATATLVVPDVSPQDDIEKAQVAIASWFEKEVFNK